MVKESWQSLIWNAPGRMWAGMLRAAPITVWQRFGGAVMVTAGVAWLIAIVWLGPWSGRVEAARLDWLGLFCVMLIVALIVCIVALFDFRLNFKASRTGIEANMQGDDDHPIATVATTTTVEEGKK